MKSIFKCVIFLLCCSIAVGQSLPDSTLTAYKDAATPRLKYVALYKYIFAPGVTESEALKRSAYLSAWLKKENDIATVDYIDLSVSGIATFKGDFSTGLSLALPALSHFEKNKDQYGIMRATNIIATSYVFAKDFEQAFDYYKKSIKVAEVIEPLGFLSRAYNDIGVAYSLANMPDSGLRYAFKAAHIDSVNNDTARLVSSISTMAENYLAAGNHQLALTLLHKSSAYADSSSEFDGFSKAYTFNDFSQAYLGLNQYDSAQYYARQSIEISLPLDHKTELLRSYQYLYKVFENKNQQDSVNKYLRIVMSIKDSVYDLDKARSIEALRFSEKFSLQEAEQEKEKLKNKVNIYTLVAGLLVFAVIVFFLYRNNRQKQKSNKILEATLTDLKATQSQLIQSEKMASLGELTAGIAHEIQNPLNFVNNFSELNSELVEEITNETDIAEIKNIANDIKQNSQKILLHGKRADAIVKGMLQHSRKGTGEKQSTDLNALCDEYLRLSYHGLKAKDEKFNTAFSTDFDKTIDKINLVPQDIGKALLNLLNNAFYAVNEKKVTAEESYQPHVLLQTKKIDNKIEIRVIDNGYGVARKLLDKIFQPFFTTKPTGQGTGLGLSISYDIVKAHGGDLKYQIVPDGGSNFTIQLPIV